MSKGDKMSVILHLNYIFHYFDISALAQVRNVSL